MTDPAAHEARKQALMANEHISWLGTANRLADMVDELIEAQRALLDDLAASRAQLEQMQDAVVWAAREFGSVSRSSMPYTREEATYAEQRMLAALAADPDPEEPRECSECGNAEPNPDCDKCWPAGVRGG